MGSRSGSRIFFAARDVRRRKKFRDDKDNLFKMHGFARDFLF